MPWLQSNVGRVGQGADLILEKPNGREELIEVKGTAAKHMAWGQLVVSSQNSHDRLTLERIKMYRVTHVFESAVFIYILTHSEHFDLKLEPRWKVKEIKGEQVIESLVAANSAGRKSKCRNRTNYELFYQYLGDRDDELVRLNLDEIEEILGDKLKKWAKDPTFWVPTRSFAKRCADAGYAIRQKNLKTRPFWVEFKRIA